MIIQFFLWWSRMRGLAPRIISGRGVTDPYLTRYYLAGNTKSVTQKGDAKGWGLYLHHFHRSDDAGDLHSHPWRWAVSLILRGGYAEEFIECGPRGQIQVRWREAGQLNLIRPTTYHRVDLHRGDTWTLFFSGPRCASWGFVLRETRQFIPWKQYRANGGGT